MTSATECSQNTGPTSSGSWTSDRFSLKKSDQLTLFAVDTLASLSVKPGSDEAREMTATSGQRLIGSWLPSGPIGACLRTLLATSVWASMTCFLTWKERVTPAGRSLYQLAPSMPRTGGIEYGLLATPRAQESASDNKNEWTGNYFRRPDGSKVSTTLSHQVAMLPTPASRDYRSPNAKPFAERGGGKKGEQLPNAIAHGPNHGLKLQPAFVEWMQGFPEGWTDCER
jgi:hypothetical protein